MSAGALVGDDGLEIVLVADHRVTRSVIPVGAEHLAGRAGDIQSGVDVPELCPADLLGGQPALVLEAPGERPAGSRD